MERDTSGRASQIVRGLGSDVDAALAEVRVPAWVVDRDGLVRWSNARAVELLGEARGRHFSGFVAPESIHSVRADFAMQIFGTARTTDGAVTLRSRDGRRLPVEVHSVALGGGRGVVGVFGLAEVRRQLPSAPLRHALTPRQQEVLRELAQGSSTDQMARDLGISRETVRNHVRGLLRTLGVHSRVEAVADARRRSLIE
jgi:PAS domain S-box-containing protein